MRRAAILPAAVLGVALALRPVPAGAFMETWVVSLQRLVSGLKVSGNQSGTRAQQVTTGFNASSMAAASVITSQDIALRIARATHTYGATTGTGYSACAVSLGLQDERDAYASAERTRRTFQRADATWLTSGGNAKDRLTDSLQQRREFYCTPAERDTGWCRGSASGGYGAGDSDAAPWLLKRNYGSEEVMMAADYLDVVAPLPTIKPNPTTAEEDLDLIRARRQGAFMTGARTTILGVVIGGMGGDRRQGATSR